MFKSDERTRVVEGAGAVDRLGVLVRELGARRAMLVTDPGVAEAGHAERAEASLKREGLDVLLHDGVSENPSTQQVAEGAEIANDFAPDLFVGVGGGSAIDAAKGIDFVHVCGGAMGDYHGHGKATKPLLPLVAVPTTAGTGSDVQSFALISDAETHRKMACGDPSAAPRIALLDPELSVTMPRRVTALTGVDALAHAVESYVAKPRDPSTDGRSKPYAAEACRLLLTALPKALDDPNDIGARADALRAAALAGLAIEHAMLGAAHAMANPLTQHFGVVHGQAVGMLLPHVVRFNGEDEDVRRHYDALAKASGLGDTDALIDAIEGVLRRTELATTLGQLDVPEDALDMLAEGATEQWTGGFNPRPLTAASFKSMLMSAC